jgi:hypothetical protein
VTGESSGCEELIVFWEIAPFSPLKSSDVSD